ncbi:hypothetical protein VU01_11164 [Candidatus Electrothrix marina]|uniref:Uncharacterized protein n=1 Tax=Candidatus Electrothrix marina TaxID=1859130 RepID=A0A444JEP8_9BACT|nr:hypothetical protein VU01_11164 [Candidatus Electrothrix marina]
MTNTEALKIIESLADGRCPMTGQILEGVYQQPDVIRALSVAARALERSERSDRRRETLPERTGKSWDTVEDQQVCEKFDTGKTVEEIAVIHQRTKGAIQSRLQRLGKIKL